MCVYVCVYLPVWSALFRQLTGTSYRYGQVLKWLSTNFSQESCSQFTRSKTPVTCYREDVIDIGIMGWYSPILPQVDGGTIQNKLYKYWWRMLLEDLTGWLDFCYPIQKFWKESLFNFS